MTFKEFKKIYEENGNKKYIKIIAKGYEKIIYACIGELELCYEKYDEKSRDWYDSEPYYTLYYYDTAGIEDGIFEEDIIDIEIINKHEFEKVERI